jgi:adenine-specific DNA-methyltransferase
VFTVADGALVACFDLNIDMHLVETIAKQKPLRAVFRDASFKNDQDRINTETTFKQLSPETKVSVI